MTNTEQATAPQSTNPNRPACIANPGNDGEKEVTLWDCPCIECWRLAQDVTDECDRELYREWRDDRQVRSEPEPAPTVSTQETIDPNLFEVIYGGFVIGTTRRVLGGSWEAVLSADPTCARTCTSGKAAVNFLHEQHLAKADKRATETTHEATIAHPVTGQYHDVLVVINDATNEIVSITPKKYGR